MENLQVLVVEDCESFRYLLSEALKGMGCRVTAAPSAEEALEIFASGDMELIVTDINLPGKNGLDLLEEIKKERPETEVVIMTGSPSLDSVLTALQAGACDYLIKPFETFAAVSSAIRKATEKIRRRSENTRLISDLRKSKEELERSNKHLMNLTIRDDLTGLYNYRYLREFLQKEIARASRHAHSFSLVFLDVDHFKNFNDNHGHMDGDEILCQMAHFLRSRLRKMDLIARYGGEEFIILLPETPAEAAFILAREIRRAIEEHPFAGEEVQPGGKLTISLGIASFPDDGDSMDLLLRKADAALYRAKRSGRNQVCRGFVTL